MNSELISVTGMPYFPGMARGSLHRGLAGDVSQCIVMIDGEPIHMLASVRHSQAASRALAVGAESIGLVRSEFLRPANGSLPDKAYYLEAFRAIAEAASGMTVTVRLLDAAADKLPAWLSPNEGAGTVTR